MPTSLRDQKQGGFTLVELMIAITVLSILLTTVTVLMISIGRLYTKGTTGTQLQNSTRNIMATLSNAVQFSSFANVPSTGSANYGGHAVKSVCVGNVEISYLVDQIPANTGNIVTGIRQTSPPFTSGMNNCVPSDLTQPAVSGKEQDLGTANEGIHTLSLTPIATNLITISIDSFSISDCDQLTGGAPGCSGGLPPGPVLCTSRAGDEFCYTADLQTSVEQRLP